MHRYTVLKLTIVVGLGLALLLLLVGLPLATEAQTPDNVFTYQGRLRRGGVYPESDSCDFRFNLYDAASGGNQVGGSQTVAGVTVVDGYFTVDLNTGDEFGTDPFTGGDRFLAVEVNCSADSSYTALSGRVQLRAVPYALYARQGSYSAGTGLSLVDTTFGLSDTYQLPQGCALGDTPQWDTSSEAWVCSSSGISSDSPWLLNGNSVSSTQFLGTVNSMPLVLKADDRTGWRLISAGSSGTPSVVGGSENNSVGGSVLGAVIGGGGSSGAAHQVEANYSVIGGGLNNTVSGSGSGWATIGGGTSNTAAASAAVVGGGQSNTAQGQYAVVPGGYGNTAGGDGSFAAGQNATASHDGAFVWADDSGSSFASQLANQFRVRAAGGVNLVADTGISGSLVVEELAYFQASSPWPPFMVSSSVVVTDLNADLLDGQHGSYYLDTANLTGTIDADLLDSLDGSQFLRSDASDIYETGNTLTVAGDATFNSRPAFDGGTSGSDSPFTVDSDFLVTDLNADLLDGQHGSYYLDASNINAGTLSPLYYSAYTDLAAENYLDNDAGTDLLTRSQADGRYATLTHTHFGETWTGSDTDGLRVQNSNTGGAALAGEATGASGVTYGVHGESSSGGGYGGFFVNSGGGNLLAANDSDTVADLEFRVDDTGNVYADEAYHCGLTDADPDDIGPCLVDSFPADFAEMLPSAAGSGPEPGDVLVVGPDGKLAPSTGAYQGAVVGIYSTRPGYLANAAYAEAEDYVPLAMVGVVPVKASAENGPIQPGDLLVSAETPGHAMRCQGVERCFGRTIGKALAPLAEGTGLIQVLVMLQ